jgi:hypothetical protein
VDPELRASLEALATETRRHTDEALGRLRREVTSVVTETADTLRRELVAAIAETRRHTDEVTGTLRGDLTETGRHYDAVAEALRDELGRQSAENRRQVGILVEGLRDDVRAVADGVLANTEEMARFREEIGARFEVEHAFFLSLFNELKRDVAELRGRY